MRKGIFCYCCMMAILACGCEFKSSAGDDKTATKTKVVTSDDNNALHGAVIKNDIDLEASGIKLKEAYLVDARNNILTENITRIGEKIYVIIKLDTGWVKENGKSFIGASERISTSAGKVVVNADDIFKDYEVTGVDMEDAKFISLSAVIKQADPGLDEFVVKFRVWDKKGSGEIRGKYNFKIKD
ncbi:MAG: hypothetical protein IPI54_12680 [Chitinophagaceae bacterium]|nr:hypothetical protein [Chitinophagaceae bacterium]